MWCIRASHAASPKGSKVGFRVQGLGLMLSTFQGFGGGGGGGGGGCTEILCDLHPKTLHPKARQTPNPKP